MNDITFSSCYILWPPSCGRGCSGDRHSPPRAYTSSPPFYCGKLGDKMMKNASIAIKMKAIITASAVLASLVIAILLLACTQVTQTTGPTTVESGESETSSTPVGTVVPADPVAGTITLTPQSITVAVGGTVHVKVVVTNAFGRGAKERFHHGKRSRLIGAEVHRDGRSDGFVRGGEGRHD